MTTYHWFRILTADLPWDMGMLPYLPGRLRGVFRDLREEFAPLLLLPDNDISRPGVVDGAVLGISQRVMAEAGLETLLHFYHWEDSLGSCTEICFGFDHWIERAFALREKLSGPLRDYREETLRRVYATFKPINLWGEAIMKPGTMSQWDRQVFQFLDPRQCSYPEHIFGGDQVGNMFYTASTVEVFANQGNGLSPQVLEDMDRDRNEELKQFDADPRNQDWQKRDDFLSQLGAGPGMLSVAAAMMVQFAGKDGARG